MVSLRRKQPRDEMGAAMATGIAQSEMNRPQSSQDQLDQALGINPFLLYDEDALRVIQSLAFQETAPGSGKFKANPEYAALFVQASYLPRASFLSAIDAEIGIRRASINLRHIQMRMSEDQFEAGGGIFVSSVLNTIIIPNFLSGVDGKLAKLTKVSPKSMEVTYREDRSKEAKGSFNP